MKVGDPLEPEARAELAAHEDHRVLERRDRALSLRVAADDAHPDAGVAEVGRGLDGGHGREADPRVGDLALEHRADLLAEQLIQPLGALAHPKPRTDGLAELGLGPRWARDHSLAGRQFIGRMLTRERRG